MLRIRQRAMHYQVALSNHEMGRDHRAVTVNTHPAGGFAPELVFNMIAKSRVPDSRQVAFTIKLNSCSGLALQYLQHAQSVFHWSPRIRSGLNCLCAYHFCPYYLRGIIHYSRMRPREILRPRKARERRSGVKCKATEYHYRSPVRSSKVVHLFIPLLWRAAT